MIIWIVGVRFGVRDNNDDAAAAADDDDDDDDEKMETNNKHIKKMLNLNS